jgi:hypothetical protein
VHDEYAARAMQMIIDVVRHYPILAGVIIISPLVGGFFGAYMGYDHLKNRLLRERMQQQVELRLEAVGRSLGELAVPIETIRRFETQAVAQGQALDILQRALTQHDRARQAVAERARFDGNSAAIDRIAAAEHAVTSLRALLETTQTVSGPGGQALVIRTGPNAFRVLFAAPMRQPPDIAFQNLPPGAEGHVVERTAAGFTVVFTPYTTAVERFGFRASAELSSR